MDRRFTGCSEGKSHTGKHFSDRMLRRWLCKRQNAFEGMEVLRKQASGCKTRSDYAAFLRQVMPVQIEEVDDGIVMRLGKKSCTCPMASEIHANKEMLCHCTCGHEKAAWSVFFGKPVDVEIVESFQRGGKDCVIKIRI